MSEIIYLKSVDSSKSVRTEDTQNTQLNTLVVDPATAPDHDKKSNRAFLALIPLLLLGSLLVYKFFSLGLFNIKQKSIY